MARVGNPLLSLALRILLNSLRSKTDDSRLAIPEVSEVPAILNLRHKDGAVVLILGRRESGKTVLAYRLAQVLGRPTYAVSPEQTTPSWVQEVRLEELSELPPPGSTLILDDLPTYMSSHSYHDPYVRTVESLIPVVRHRRQLILIFSAQSSSMSDRYVLDSDLIFLKPMGLLYGDLERPAVKRLYDRVTPIFNRMTEPQQRRHVYLFSETWRGIVRIDRPV